MERLGLFQADGTDIDWTSPSAEDHMGHVDFFAPSDGLKALFKVRPTCLNRECAPLHDPDLLSVVGVCGLSSKLTLPPHIDISAYPIIHSHPSVLLLSKPCPHPLPPSQPTRSGAAFAEHIESLPPPPILMVSRGGGCLLLLFLPFTPNRTKRTNQCHV
jgi:hypothetical protein